MKPTTTWDALCCLDRQMKTMAANTPQGSPPSPTYLCSTALCTSPALNRLISPYPTSASVSTSACTVTETTPVGQPYLHSHVSDLLTAARWPVVIHVNYRAGTSVREHPSPRETFRSWHLDIWSLCPPYSGFQSRGPGRKIPLRLTTRPVAEAKETMHQPQTAAKSTGGSVDRCIP
ncbi:hypothetical protein LZ30DRAFT_84609 [Colletotrichum cereale]|nr:hypothetical protein LZ30DRAFT_84609 [Colletotrichum cereale]